MTHTRRSVDWRWATGVHCAVVDDDLVLLDVGADAYSCLPGRAAAIGVTEQGLRFDDDDLAQILSEAGLITSRPDDTPIMAGRTAPRPVESALRKAYPTPRSGDLRAGAAALVNLALHYRGRSFGRILDHALARASTREESERSPDLDAAVDAFHRWIPYAPVSGKCLLRSFMLLGHLRRAGLDAQWVFGVATWPFSAHCWLQCGDLVLDETVERARSFTPILVV